MSRLAVISDIHANIHAFRAVLKRIGAVGVDEILCLGDIVGYGAEPGACVDLVVRHCTHTIKGNHDEAAVDPACSHAFNGAAREAILWTRENLTPMHVAALNRLRTHHSIPTPCGREILCVHDSPSPGPTDYVHDRLVAAGAFAGVEGWLCLLGHTHVPIVFEAAPHEPGRSLTARDVTAWIPGDRTPVDLSPDRRYILNPGSVGQPRDCDPRASFAVLDLGARTFTVHRVDYDVAAAQQDTLRAGLPTVLADRLAVGA